MRKNVVVGYDGSPTSRVALIWALQSAEQRGLDAEVVHVLTVPTAVSAGYGMTAASDVADLRPYAESVLREAAELAARTAPAVTVTTQLVIGNPAEGLLSTLADADRVVLGSRGRGTFAELLLGSVSLELASRAPCPVVVIRGGTENLPAGTEAHRVVVGVDGSPASLLALGFAFEEASVRGCGLTVLHAWAQPYFDVPGRGGPIPSPSVSTSSRARRCATCRRSWPDGARSTPTSMCAARSTTAWPSVCSPVRRLEPSWSSSARARAGRLPLPAAGVREPRCAAPRPLPGDGGPRAGGLSPRSGARSVDVDGVGRPSGGRTPGSRLPRMPFDPAAYDKALDRAAAHARALAGLACRTAPCRRGRRRRRWRDASAARCPTARPTRPTSSTCWPRRVEPGLMAMPSGPVLRLGDRRHAAGRARRRLAGQRAGTRTPACGSRRRARPRPRRSPAAGCSTCSGCRPTADVGFVTGGDDGQLHRPGRRPPAAC